MQQNPVFFTARQQGSPRLSISAPSSVMFSKCIFFHPRFEALSSIIGIIIDKDNPPPVLPARPAMMIGRHQYGNTGEKK